MLYGSLQVKRDLGSCRYGEHIRVRQNTSFRYLRELLLSRLSALFIWTTMLLPGIAYCGAQQYEPLSDSVRAALSRSIADKKPPNSSFKSPLEASLWLAEMSPRLLRRMPDNDQRVNFLRTVHYEATRAGLDPELVLGLIQVESGFKKYALSSAGARGYMQVMPFWIKLIGRSDDSLFHMRTNLRYGCTILRHYLDIEKGDLYRALGRYNGSLGQPQYPNMVHAAWKNQWSYNASSKAKSPSDL